MNQENISKLRKHTKKLVLLYVEKDISLARELLSTLDSMFSVVIYATDGADGLKKFNENHIDLVITCPVSPRYGCLNLQV